jgi:potassium channel LctB
MIQLRTLIYLGFLYSNVILTFSAIYMLLHIFNLGMLRDHYASIQHHATLWDGLTRSLYFSAITLFSVGYGDITPFGWARAVSIIEAMIGYLLPAVLVVRFFDSVKSSKS